jgi:hypothetical protein
LRQTSVAVMILDTRYLILKKDKLRHTSAAVLILDTNYLILKKNDSTTYPNALERLRAD